MDTGWVTDMAPDGVGQVAATHETWVGPPLDEEDIATGGETTRHNDT